MVIEGRLCTDVMRLNHLPFNVTYQVTLAVSDLSSRTLSMAIDIGGLNDWTAPYSPRLELQYGLDGNGVFGLGEQYTYLNLHGQVKNFSFFVTYTYESAHAYTDLR